MASVTPLISSDHSTGYTHTSGYTLTNTTNPAQKTPYFFCGSSCGTGVQALLQHQYSSGRTSRVTRKCSLISLPPLKKRCFASKCALTLLGLQGTIGGKLLRIRIVCPQNGNGVLKGPGVKKYQAMHTST